MKTLFFAILMALIVMSSVIQAQELISTTPDKDGKILYKFSLPAVLGYNDPYISGDYMGFDGDSWAKIPVENNGYDQYIFTITGYDGPVEMYYSSYSQPYNPKLSKLPDYDKSRKLLRFYLAGGKKYEADSYVPILPGKEGDNTLRFEWIGNKLRVYCNLLLLPKNFNKPFAVSSCNEWQEVMLQVNNSTGWGYVDLDVSKNNYEPPRYIGFGYGGKVDDLNVWPNISDSQFIHKDKGEIDGLYFSIPSK